MIECNICQQPAKATKGGYWCGTCKTWITQVGDIKEYKKTLSVNPVEQKLDRIIKLLEGTQGQNMLIIDILKDIKNKEWHL